MLIFLIAFSLAGCGGERGQAAGNHNNDRLRTVDDIKDKRIGVLLGSIHDDYARKNYPQATILQYKSLSDLILAVKTGKVDAGFFSPMSRCWIFCRATKSLVF